MSIPGANLLAQARRALRFDLIPHMAFTGRTQNDALEWVNEWGPPVNISASVQPVDRKTYAMLGLELSKDYVWVWTSAVVKDVERDNSGDKVIWRDREWQARDGRDWTGVDGWRKVLCVDIGPVGAPPPVEN